MDVLIQRSLRQQQEQLGASIALVRWLVTCTQWTSHDTPSIHVHVRKNFECIFILCR